jgi:Na+/serine symporter
MTRDMLKEYLLQLNVRRKQLGMPLGVLTKRSGLSKATVCRLLRGDTKAHFLNVVCLAEALGVACTLASRPTEDVLRDQAEKQAKRVVGMVQGTMGLEAQGVDEEGVATLVEHSQKRLLEGPRKKLWWEG